MFGNINCTSPPPTILSVQTAVVSGLLSLVTIPGNLLVLLAFILDPSKRMRTPFHYFILNINFSDMLVGFVVEPLSVDFHIRESLHIKVPSALGEPLRVSYFVASTASVLGITALTADRWIAVTFPMTYKYRLSQRRALFASILIWFLSFALSSLYFISGFILYSFVFMNIAVMTSCSFLVFVYVKIVLILRRRTASVNGSNVTVISNTYRAQIRKRDQQITNTLLTMLLAFLFCYIPSCVMIYTMNLCDTCSCETIYWLRDWSFLGISLNSAINPFVYALQLPHFRESVVRIFKCNEQALYLVDTSVGALRAPPQLALRAFSNPSTMREDIEQLEIRTE